MKAFSLEEYLKNPSKKVVTREGRDVRIICTDRKGDCPIVALIKERDGNSEVVAAYSKNGITNQYASALFDLLFAPEEHEKWINIYRNTSGVSSGSVLYDSREDAEKVGKTDGYYVATVKIDWEE